MKKTQILMVVSLLFGAFFVLYGLDKFSEFMPEPESMTLKSKGFVLALQQSEWIMPLIGVVEIVGGLLLMIPQYRALGAVVIAPVVVCIVLANAYQNPDNLPFAAILPAVLLWIMFENRKKYAPMLKA